MNIPEIYVLWHPDCALGEVLARRTYAWLRPGNGLGPQVYFRCFPAPGAHANGLPIPLEGEKRQDPDKKWDADLSGECNAYRITNLQIVIPLIDEHMVCDPAWRHWLAKLSKDDHDKERVLFPVALDPTAYNTPPELQKLNFLRPSGLPFSNTAELLAGYHKVWLNQTASASDREQHDIVEAVVRSFLKQLTETMARVVLPRSKKDLPTDVKESSRRAPPKVTIFLSHAKADGRLPAQRMRDYIYSQTQLAAFFDENDIAFSAVFATVLNNNLDSPDTAAMIAVRSARYAERPWCRREVSSFRKPKKVSSKANDNGVVEQWRIHPLLVIEAMEPGSQTCGIPELGNAPAVRWNAEATDIEEQILTHLIRDCFLAAYHEAVAGFIYKKIKPKSQTHYILLNWLPDPTTLLMVLEQRQLNHLKVIYPGEGLSGAELNVLDAYFPNIWFSSYEDMLSLEELAS